MIKDMYALFENNFSLILYFWILFWLPFIFAEFWVQIWSMFVFIFIRGSEMNFWDINHKLAFFYNRNKDIQGAPAVMFAVGSVLTFGLPDDILEQTVAIIDTIPKDDLRKRIHIQSFFWFFISQKLFTICWNVIHESLLFNTIKKGQNEWTNLGQCQSNQMEYYENAYHWSIDYYISTLLEDDFFAWRWYT